MAQLLPTNCGARLGPTRATPDTVNDCASSLLREVTYLTAVVRLYAVGGLSAVYDVTALCGSAASSTNGPTPPVPRLQGPPAAGIDLPRVVTGAAQTADVLTLVGKAGSVQVRVRTEVSDGRVPRVGNGGLRCGLGRLVELGRAFIQRRIEDALAGELTSGWWRRGAWRELGNSPFCPRFAYGVSSEVTLHFVTGDESD